MSEHQGLFSIRTGPKPPERAGRAAQMPLLGPARVVRTCEGGGVIVDVGTSAVRATMALAFPYTPKENDVLLVIGEGERHYVIGVITATGDTSLTLPGNVEIRAEGGTLTLSGDQGVHVSGPEIALDARTVRTLADALVQKVGTLVQRVTSLLSERAGERETIVDGASVTRAKSAAILTEGTMTLNGKQIHLG